VFNRDHDLSVFDLVEFLESVESILRWILRLHVLSFEDLKVLKFVTETHSF
jgi:hypothetical protein